MMVIGATYVNNAEHNVDIIIQFPREGRILLYMCIPF